MAESIGYGDNISFVNGDLLSMDNMRNIKNRVLALIIHPGKSQLSKTILGALAKVREGSGDLHILMHMLVIIYIYYSGAFLQPIQSLLKWKRIQLNPLIQFQGSKYLLMLVNEEATRLLTISFFE